MRNKNKSKYFDHHVALLSCNIVKCFEVQIKYLISKDMGGIDRSIWSEFLLLASKL